MIDEGCEKGAKSGICAAIGTETVGAFDLETTRVAVIVTDPESSVAMISTGTPTTFPAAISPFFGVP